MDSSKEFRIKQSMKPRVVSCERIIYSFYSDTFPYGDHYIRMIPEVSSESHDLSQSKIVMDAVESFRKLITDVLTAEVGPIRANFDEKIARIRVLEKEIETRVGLCPRNWVLE